MRETSGFELNKDFFFRVMAQAEFVLAPNLDSFLQNNLSCRNKKKSDK